MLGRIIPAYNWLRNYKRSDWPSDLTAGAVVAVMLVPRDGLRDPRRRRR